MNLLPHAGLLPVAQPTPAGHAATAAHLLREILPGDTGLEYEQDTGPCLAVFDRLATPFGPRFWWGSTGFDEFPEFVREQLPGHESVLHDHQQIRIAAHSSAHPFIEHDVLLDGLSLELPALHLRKLVH